MFRLVVFGSILLFAAFVCQGQQQAKESSQKQEKKARSTSLSVSTETDGDSETGKSSIGSNLKPRPKKWQIGGSLIDLVSAKADTPPSTDDSKEPAKLKGLQLLNPFAPIANEPRTPLNWKARRGSGFRFQDPKEGEPEGIQLFFLGF